jgi:hypothetical protein
LVSTDEKTGIQALEHLHPSRPMRPGLRERLEWEYVRHGTQCLIANLEVARNLSSRVRQFRFTITEQPTPSSAG